jgi:hypothetical protein
MKIIRKSKLDRAVEFFKSCGIKFISRRNERGNGFSILIDKDLQSPVLIDPFSFAMSGRDLIRFHRLLHDGERFWNRNSKNIQILVQRLNVLAKRASKKEIYYSIDAEKIIAIWCKIARSALEQSGLKECTLSQLTTLLGGEVGVHYFFREVVLATEASIPLNKGEGSKLVVRNLLPISCYTCKYCEISENGHRSCAKNDVSVSLEDLRRNPRRFSDLYYSEDTESMMSSIIDYRMIGCSDYEPRI